jgi:hypothetical protein
MENRFKRTTIGNVLQSLSSDDALRVIALSLAANDLTLNVEAIGRFPASESMYFFVTSLSILRELAKLVAKIDTGTFQGKMSGETEGLLQEVKSSLASFEKGSLVKDTLKPIRDVTFHFVVGGSEEGSRVIEMHVTMPSNSLPSVAGPRCRSAVCGKRYA